jgi:hypothetical protein
MINHPVIFWHGYYSAYLCSFELLRECLLVESKHYVFLMHGIIRTRDQAVHFFGFVSLSSADLMVPDE